MSLKENAETCLSFEHRKHDIKQYIIIDNEDDGIGYLKFEYNKDAFRYYVTDDMDKKISTPQDIQKEFLNIPEIVDMIKNTIVDKLNIDTPLAALQIESIKHELIEDDWYISRNGSGYIRHTEGIDENLYEVVDKAGNCKLRFIEVSEMLAEKYNTISFADVVYIYDNGIFVDGMETLKTAIANLSKDVGCKCGVTNSIKEIITYITYDKPEKEYPFNTYSNMIPVKNGIVVIDFENGTFKLIPHNPKFKFNYKFDVDFKQLDESNNNNVIDGVFHSYVAKHDVDILYQIPAQALLQGLGSAPFKKAYLLQGDPHAAKSGYLEFLSRLFGENSISNVSLQAIGGDRFALANLEGKTFNMYDDLSSVPIKDGGVFKTLTGGHNHEVQRKGIQGHKAKITAVHVYTCNTPPEFDKSVQHDTAFWERWEYIKFINVFDVDPYFYDKTFTKENLEVAFYKILEYVVGVHNKGLKVNSTASEVREKWSYSADPFYMYIGANLTDSERTIHVEKDELIKSYQRWCVANDIDRQKIITSKRGFTQTIDKYGIFTSRVVNNDGVRISSYEMPYTYNIECEFAVKRIMLKTEQDKLS
ncbi:MAG: hypothetical protein KAJ39_09430 [Gammaproteobacteria bacterium]|nr:hypothetical protein [Gammaproteobacteria bacterium]